MINVTGSVSNSNNDCQLWHSLSDTIKQEIHVNAALPELLIVGEVLYMLNTATV